MNDSESPRMVRVVKDGLGPLLAHVRDEENSIRTLPVYDVAACDEYEIVPLELGPFVGSIALPPDRVAHSVPDGSCAHWSWSDGSSLILLQWDWPHLPYLESLTRWPLGTFQMLVNARPMALKIENANEKQDARIDGYLDDHSCFGVNIRASNSAQCDRLVATVTTLRVARATRENKVAWQERQSPS